MITELIGVTLASIDGAVKDSAEIKFIAEDRRSWRMFHEQDCCEYVYVEDVNGEVADLIGTPIIDASERSENNSQKDCTPGVSKWDESYRWTFYRLSTIKGTVVIRWYGVSNGYYSESVSFEAVKGGEA